jgi:solute carrier family 25 protein 44
MQVMAKGQMNLSAPKVFSNILRQDGVLGLYRGYTTVVVGAIPTRMVLLTTLETTKLAVSKLTDKLEISEPAKAAISNGVAGLVSSLLSQAVFVPLDVVCKIYFLGIPLLLFFLILLSSVFLL